MSSTNSSKNSNSNTCLNKLISLDELKEMFKAQEVLNKKYNGENWRDSITPGRAEAAFTDEVAEFLREIEPIWKWWSGKAKAKVIDKTKAAFELIDMIHFALMIVLYRFSLDKVLFTIEEEFEYTPSPRVETESEPLSKFTTAYIEFLANCRYSINYGMVRRVIELIETGGVLLGLEPGQIYEAYQKKNALNSKRAEPQMAGTYDKSKEQDLTLGD